jgi:hypothetical protein
MHLTREIPSPENLAAKFDISLSAAKIRVEILTVMERRRAGIARPLPESVTRFLAEHRRSTKGSR